MNEYHPAGGNECWEPPPYGKAGWVLAEIVDNADGSSAFGCYVVEESAVDTEASTFWIVEGTGVEFWVNEFAPDDLAPGWYVWEPVTGHYFRGDWGVTDDEEEWDVPARPRLATEQERLTLSVNRRHEARPE